MRIRSIKPEFWRSDDITALAWVDRLLFIGLWSYVDDNGVGLDKLSAITADLFAGDVEKDAQEAFARVSRGLQSLEKNKRITRYTVEGRKYIHITNWDKHQRVDRPNKARYPLPTRENTPKDTAPAKVSRDTPESPSTGTEEQRNRGTDNSCAPKAVRDGFATFWDTYPRKKGKQKAEAAWAKATRKTPPATILASLQAHLTEWEGKEQNFIPYPATWLNQGRWDDELEIGQIREINPDEVLGQDYWTPPAAPPDLSIEDGIAWQRERQAERRAERVEQAKRRLAGV